jgi:hypothetical protein
MHFICTLPVPGTVVQYSTANKRIFYTFSQCCVREFFTHFPSVADPDPTTGSTFFLASRIRIRIHLSEVWIRILLWIRIRILLSSCKNSKKNLDSYHFVTLFEFLSLKNDVNAASKSHKQKKLCYNKICKNPGFS